MATLAELDRLAAPLHARVITREGMETMQRLAYEAGRDAAGLSAETLAAAMAVTQQKHPRWQPLNRDGFRPWADRILDALGGSRHGVES